MTEKPILFSGPMVRAILSGAKTQTRRVMKPQPQESYSTTKRGEDWHKHSYGWSWRVRPDMPCIDVRDNDLLSMWCPYGAPGDRLWVRETWRWYGRDRRDGPEGGLEYRADGTWRTFESMMRSDETWAEFIKAYNLGKVNVWRPSIHMPRWASRITLEVVSVRVERLQDISDEDAKAEGIERHGDEYGPSYLQPSGFGPIEAFRYLWDSINGARPGCSWADNPWVWVVEFKRANDPV